MRASRRRCLHLLPALALAGCGFQLRQPPTFTFRTIALTGFNASSQTARDLKLRLDASPTTRVVPTMAAAEVVFEALTDDTSRSVAASTVAAEVRELQVRVRLVFRVRTPSGRELVPQTELVQTRDLSYSESIALAKEYEESQLVRAMQTDLVDQVMRRLAAVRL